MPSSPVVYLDTQDFSRFGDVLRGKSDHTTRALFLALEQRAQSGNAIFAVSAPILGELLQYDADYRETTIKKAEAVERLCGSWALAFPSRLIAAEIAEAAKRRGLVIDTQDTKVLSSERYWFPNIGNTFGDIRDIRARMREAVDAQLAALHLPTRVMRRRAKKQFRKLDPDSIIRKAAPDMAAHFGLPIEAVLESIVALFRGTVTPEEASRRLFVAIAEPVKFVEAYFEKLDTDRSEFPGWISKFGTDFEALFLEIRSKVQPFMKHVFARNDFDRILADWGAKAGKAVLGMAGDDIVEFGVDAALLSTLTACDEFTAEVPACEIAGTVLIAYIRQIMGVAKIERSFGGDLVHALYLPHVDLWRGDRRFSTVVSDAVPRYAKRVVPTLTALPDAIGAWRTARRLTEN